MNSFVVIRRCVFIRIFIYKKPLRRERCRIAHGAVERSVSQQDLGFDNISNPKKYSR